MTRYTPLWLQAGSYAASVDRRLISAVWPVAAVSGMAVSPLSAMTVNVAPGWCVVPSANSTGSVLCASDAVEVVGPLSAAPGAGVNRIDLIICQVASADIGAGSGDVFTITFVTGTPAASPVAPAVPAGATVLAQIYIPALSASITAGNITDRRAPAISGGSNQYKAALGRTAIQSVAAGSATVTLDTAVFDPAGMLSGGNLKVPAAGYWSVAYAATVGGAASGPFQANLQRNAAVVALGSAHALNLGINVTSVGSALVQCRGRRRPVLERIPGQSGRHQRHWRGDR